MKNGLYIVSTPIGNLGDISFRASETLKNSDIIICENPKHSLKLLSKLEIKKKLFSLHDYNEEIIIDKIGDDLKNKKYSLISDAGSPLISDPGYKLVRFCIQNNIYVTVVPGASSVTSALQLSSIPINKYSFHGFLPKSKKNIDEFINLLKESSHTCIFFVSSHKILSFLESFSEQLPDKKIAVCKEITKINEAVFVGLATEVLINFKKNTKNSLGEFVVVTEGADDINKSKDDVNIEIYDIIKKLLKKFSLTDTVDIVHRIGNMSKNKLYKKALELQNEK
jgi:16S rRNA (cytidine1402-2'-O)-methyltransferase